MATRSTRPPLLTKQEAFAANLERAHECLVEAKNCVYAASQQTDNTARRHVYEHFTARIAEHVGDIAIFRHENGVL